MTAKKVSDIVRLGPVIPVLAFDSAEQGENVSRALHAGGVKVLSKCFFQMTSPCSTSIA